MRKAKSLDAPVAEETSGTGLDDQQSVHIPSLLVLSSLQALLFTKKLGIFCHFCWQVCIDSDSEYLLLIHAGRDDSQGSGYAQKMGLIVQLMRRRWAPRNLGQTSEAHNRDWRAMRQSTPVRRSIEVQPGRQIQ